MNTLLALHATVARLISVPDALTICAALAGLLITLLFLPIAAGIILAIVAGGGMVIFANLTYGDFDETVQHDMQCILACNATDNGAGVVTFDFSAVQDAVVGNISGLNIWAAIDKYLTIIGESGLNLAGATTAITDADCTDCGCCFENTTADVPYQDFTSIPFGIFASYNQVAGQGGLWYADAEGDGGTWVMTLSAPVQISSVGFNCNSYGGAKFTVTIGTQSTELDYGGIVGWNLPTPQTTDTITIVQSSIPSNIRLSFNAFQVVYC